MKQSQSGFTLAEVLMSMLLTSVVGGTVVTSMVYTTNVVGQNSLATEAIAVAQEALEDLRTYPYEEIASATTTSEDGTYEIERVVSDDEPEEGMKAIEVTVSWDWKGQEKSYVLRTIYAKINKT